MIKWKMEFALENKRLENRTKNKILVPDVKIAKDFFSRAKGLIGTSHLSPDQGLWLWSCNSIHTFFMRYPIDCIFVDTDLKVKAVFLEVVPWRVIWPVKGAHSVFELLAGALPMPQNIEVGDLLYVGS